MTGNTALRNTIAHPDGGADGETLARMYRTAVLSSASAIMISDSTAGDRPIIFTNPAFTRITGYSTAEVVGRNARFLVAHDPDQPALVMLTNDGENYWGGGSSFWNEFAPGFMNAAPSHGKKAITIPDFVAAHPPAVNDVVHVEDGSWLGIRPGHAPLIAATSDGEMKVRKDHQDQTVAIKAGILTLSDNLVSILTTH